MTIRKMDSIPKKSEVQLMKDEFDELVKAANMIAIAKLLLREGIIDNGSYNSIVHKIKTPA